MDNDLEKYVEWVIDNCVLTRVNFLDDWIRDNMGDDYYHAILMASDEECEYEWFQIWIVDARFGEWLEANERAAFENPDSDYFWLRGTFGCGLDMDNDIVDFAKYIKEEGWHVGE